MLGKDLIVPTKMETAPSIVKIGKWQWHYYRYRAEVIKGLLGRINGPVQQRRINPAQWDGGCAAPLIPVTGYSGGEFLLASWGFVSIYNCCEYRLQEHRAL